MPDTSCLDLKVTQSFQRKPYRTVLWQGSLKIVSKLVWLLHRGEMDYLFQNLIQISRLVVSHKHQKGMKWFITHIMKLLGGRVQGKLPLKGPKCADRVSWYPEYPGKVWVSMVFRRWSEHSFTTARVPTVWSCTGTKGECIWVFLSSCPAVGQTGRGKRSSLQAMKPLVQVSHCAALWDLYPQAIQGGKGSTNWTRQCLNQGYYIAMCTWHCNYNELFADFCLNYVLGLFSA